MRDDDEAASSNEGADPSEDIKKQNPGETTTADLVENGMPGHEAAKE